MALFNFGKKNGEKKTPACCCESTEIKSGKTTSCCGGPVSETEEVTSCCGRSVEGICCIKVLGSGCKSCHALLEAAKEAAKNMRLSLEVEYITDMETIMEYGIMSMPGLVVNDQIVSMGKVLKSAEIEKLLRKYAAFQ